MTLSLKTRRFHSAASLFFRVLVVRCQRQRIVGFDDTPAQSLARAMSVIEWGGEPRVQADRPLTWLDARKPFAAERGARGWTEETIVTLPRFFYGYHWRRMTFDAFRAYTRARPFERNMA